MEFSFDMKLVAMTRHDEIRAEPREHIVMRGGNNQQPTLATHGRRKRDTQHPCGDAIKNTREFVNHERASSAHQCPRDGEAGSFAIGKLAESARQQHCVGESALGECGERDGQRAGHGVGERAV
ncbi:hypothetical protein LBMAG48_02060 [Phycisphaerae bacterium]|nr:hypothetical protein LBMAG48_02060 [Phycisphaerae bacterium]